MPVHSLATLRQTSDVKFRKLQLHMFSQIDGDAILEFSTTVSRATAKKLKVLSREQRKQAKKLLDQGIAAEVLNHYVEDELALAEEVTHLADKLAIVALYGKVELSIKAMLGVAIPTIDVKQLFRWKNVGRALQRIGITLQSIASYKDVNQLRCLNNAIKHGTKVGSELASTGWGRAQDDIDASKCARELYDFVENGSKFLLDLRGHLLRSIVNNKTIKGDS